jgi:homoserine dehydrogenase
MRLLFVGFGTVGQGLAELLIEKKAQLLQDYGLEFTVVGISDEIKGSLFNPKGLDLEKALEAAATGKNLAEDGSDGFDGDALAMIGQAEADVMLEATYTDIKTGEPAVSHVREALQKGIHVVTTNKGPVALFYEELAGLAKQNKKEFLFEGTVMSGTPLLNFIRETLAGSAISEIKGILNGTTNYILTRMKRH